MIRGTRVCIEKAPKGHKDLKGKEGKVVSLVPKACIPLEYNIKIGKEEILLPFTSVKILDYEDDRAEIDPEEVDPMLKVNGLCYCKNHRLETCHQCGYDFLCQNIGTELYYPVKKEGATQEEIDVLIWKNMELSDNISDQLRAMGAPTRRAPHKNLKEKPFDNYSPIVNDAVISIPAGTNFQTLGEFPSEKPLWSAFASQFLKSMVTREMEQETERPLYKVRKIFSSIGEALDTSRFASKPFPRIIIQDEAQSKALILDIIAVRMMVGIFSPGVKWRLPVIVFAMCVGFFSPGVKWRLPVIVFAICVSFFSPRVKWRLPVIVFSMCYPTGPQDLAASMAILEKGTLMYEVKAAPHEIDLFAEIVEANADRLSNEKDDYVYNGHKVLKDHSLFTIGVIAPISGNNNDRYYELLGEYCDFCTASKCKLSACSRCKKVLYCNKGCQKAAWKKHKLVCKV